jgi:type IV pilus assembly protein PilQ
LTWAQTIPDALPPVLTASQRPINPASASSDPPISLNFQNIDMKALLQVFADFSGLNVVPTDSVTGPVSVRLNDVPWPQALDIVLQSKGLVSRQEGRVLWVAPQGEWAMREKKQLDAQAALEAVSPLQMLSVRLQYARATEVAQRLQGGAAGSSGGRLGRATHQPTLHLGPARTRAGPAKNAGAIGCACASDLDRGAHRRSR